MNSFLFLVLGMLKPLIVAGALPSSDGDVVKSGSYAIVNCGQHASSVVTMLKTIYDASIQAIQDAESSSMSPAYRTFFKDPENTAFVSNILVNVSAGAAVHPPNAYTDGAPVLVCVDSPNQLVGSLPDGGRHDVYTSCTSSRPRTVQSLTGTPYIALCRNFWTSGLGTTLALPPPNKCLGVSGKNKFSVNRLGRAGPEMTQYAIWVLLQMIVYIYLFPEQLKGRARIASLVDDANEVLKLSADQSLMNLDSYVLYVASVYGHCTQFPDPVM